MLDQCANRAGAAPDLCILDPIARFYAGDENNQREVGRFVATLDALIERFRLAFLIPHPSKPIKGDLREGGAKFRGMAGLWAAADATWWLAKTGDQGITLSFEDLRHGIPPDPISLERSQGLWLTPNTVSDEQLKAVRRCVLSIGLTWTKLRNAVMADLNVAQATAERLIAQAVKGKLIVKDSEGIYRSRDDAPRGGHHGHQAAADGEPTS
jgi:AAA domain